MLIGANLEGANLDGADLTSAGLNEAVFPGASLRNATLKRASLVGTNLSVADLAGADLAAVLYDEGTGWPEGFDPSEHGAVKLGAMAHLPRADLRGAILPPVSLACARLAGADPEQRDAGPRRPALRDAHEC